MDYKQVAPRGLIFDEYIFFLLQTGRRYATKKAM